MNKKKTLVVIVILMFGLLLNAQEDIGIGSTNIETERVFKQYANTEVWLKYKRTSEWDDYYHELVDIHQVWIKDDMPMMLAFTFKNKVVHIIYAIPELSGSNIQQSDLNYYKDFLNSKEGQEKGFKNIGDGIYIKTWTDGSMKSYVSFVSIQMPDGGTYTFLYESEYKEGVIVMRNTWNEKIVKGNNIKIQNL